MLDCERLMDERKLRMKRSWKTYIKEGEVNEMITFWPKVRNSVTSKI